MQPPNRAPNSNSYYGQQFADDVYHSQPPLPPGSLPSPAQYRRNRAPPPPPGAGPPLSSGSPPQPPRDYFAAPGPPPSSPATYQQPYAPYSPSPYPRAGQQHPSAGNASAGAFGGSGYAYQRDSVTELIGQYGDLSPGSQSSFGSSRNGSPSPQPSPVLAGPPSAVAAFQSFSQPAYTPNVAAYAPVPGLQRTHSAAASPPRQPHQQPPAPPLPPHSHSFSGYPAAQYAHFTPQPPIGALYSSRAEPTRIPAQQPPFRGSPGPPLGEQRQRRGDSLVGQQAPPSDAFYVSDPDRQKAAALYAVREAASGDWTSASSTTLPAHIRTSSQPHAAAAVRPTGPGPTKQPTMVLSTPPLGATRTSQRTPSVTSVTPSVSSVSSAVSYPSSSSTYHTQYANSPTGTTRVPSHNGRSGTLSPNTSFGAVSLLRADSLAPSSSLADHFDGTDYLNVALLSNIAVWFKDHVPQGSRTKGSLELPNCFTGDEVVVRCFFPAFSLPSIRNS